MLIRKQVVREKVRRLRLLAGLGGGSGGLWAEGVVEHFLWKGRMGMGSIG